MTISQLRAFLAVAEHCSIRAAARALGLTQPAVTQSMRELEASLGVPLLQRGATGVKLTSYGTTLVRRAGLISREIERAAQEIHELRDGNTGLVSVSFSTAVALDLLPRAFNAFRARFSQVEFRLAEASIPHTLPRLLDGSMDFMVAHMLPGTLADWEVETLYTTAMVATARKGHPVLRATDPASLAQWEWLMPYDDDSAPTLVRQLLAGNRIPAPERIVRCTTAVMGLKLVGESDLVGVFVDTMAEREFALYGIEKVPLGDPLAALDVCVIRRPGAVLSPAAQNFLDCLRREAQSR